MRKLFFSLLLMGLGGCIISPLSSLESRDRDVSKGKRYFQRECGRCHDFVFPGERTAGQWQAILARKKGKVSLTTAQYDQLRRYVIVEAQ